MLLENIQQAVNLKGKFNNILFLIIITALTIISCILFLHHTMGEAIGIKFPLFIDQANTITSFFVVNITLLIYAFVSIQNFKKSFSKVYDEKNVLDEYLKLFTESKDVLFFGWDINEKKIYLSRDQIDLKNIDQNNSISFEEFNRKIIETDKNLYQIANDLIRNKSHTVDTQFKFKNNHAQKWYNLKACSLSSEENDKKFLIGFMIDITDTKNEEIVSQKLNNSLSEAIDGLPVAFALWNRRNELLLCNSKYREYFSLPLSVAKRGSTYEDINKLSTKSILELDLTSEYKNNDPRIENISEVQLKDKRWLLAWQMKTANNYKSWIGIDVSDQKINEQKLLQNENTLISKVEELENLRRKQDIQSKQLIDLAEKYHNERNNLEEMENDKAQFLLNMSHELRTPLNAIIGFSDLLISKKTHDEEKVNEYAKDIHKSGNELLEIIDNIQEISKLEKEDIKVNKDNQRIDKIIDEVLDEFNNDLNDKNIKLLNKFSFNKLLHCNKIAIKQAISNVVSNSIKYSRNNGAISIDSNTENGWLNILIKDNGHGIPQDKLENIFRPFNKSKKLAITNREGAGFGLPITKSLLDTHDGQIHVQSEVGKGTIITLSLPLIVNKSQPIQRKTA
tara:strand:+ start:8310 stop:10175 length:1866 start_codon:yes stop_codon:yes gene_type:complete